MTASYPGEHEIDSETKKVKRELYGLTFIKSCTKEVLKRRLVTALVVPHLDYCSVVYLDASADLRTRLQRLSNSCVRYIYEVSMLDVMQDLKY